MTDTATTNQTTDFDITCPSCGADLQYDETFLQWRVCASCNRHFSMTALERAGTIVDDNTFRLLQEHPTSAQGEEDMQASALDRLANARERAVVQEAIVTGTGELGGTTVVVIALDDQLVGNQIGALGAEKIISAFDYALSHRTPVIGIVAGGTSPLHLGPLAVVQGARIASIAAQIQAQGIPMIGILTHPTSAAVFNSFGSLFDVIFAEPGTSVGVVWAPDFPLDAAQNAVTEDGLLENGWIDGIVSRPQQHERVGNIISLIARHTVEVEIPDTAIPTDLDRPLVEYLDVVIAPFTELRGDRVEYDDRGVITGIGAIDTTPVAVVVQDSRVETRPSAAIRKIQRLARFAGRFELPLVMIVDGAEPVHPFSVSPDESFAVAKLSAMLSVLPIPVVSVGAGTVQGLVSNVMMYGDLRMMAEHAQYKLTSGSSRIPGGQSGEARAWPASSCQSMGLIDQVIEMPEGGVSEDPWLAVRMLREDVHNAVVELSRLGQRRLIERRARTQRELGHTEEGVAAVLGELSEWQDVQQSVRGSIDDWREKLEQRMNNSEWREKLEQRSQMPNFQRPDMSEIFAGLKARQERLKHELLERTRSEQKDDGSG